jgi:hypothetical protein
MCNRVQFERCKPLFSIEINGLGKDHILENPRVGGSIPPLATIQINDLAQPSRLGFVVSGIHVGGV